jgi:transcriptional regulator with XRE-family HTH domain
MSKNNPLLDWRLGQGLTQAEAAEAAGVSQEMWSMMETGVKPTPTRFLSRIRGLHRSSDSGRRGPYKYGSRA